MGLMALPLYGILTFWSTLDPQPDQSKDPEAWAHFVSTPSYLMSHLFGSVGGTICAIFGVFALGAYLANSRAGRLGMIATVMTALGQALFLVIGGISTFATPAIGQAYLEGTKDVMQPADVDGDPLVEDEQTQAASIVAIAAEYGIEMPPPITEKAPL